MRRLALVGVLTGLLTNVGCMKDEPVEPPVDPVPDAGPVLVGCQVSGAGVGRSQQAMRAANAESADGREAVLVHFRRDRTGDVRDVERLGGKVNRDFRSLRMVAARLTPAQISALARNPDVESVVPDRKVYALGFTVPPASYLLKAPAPAGSVGEVTPGLKMVQADQVWDSNKDGILDTGAPTGAGIKVCVIDSGIDPNHPELKIPYIGGKDFVDNDNDPSDVSSTTGLPGGGHGTHVAGTIAAQFANGAKVNPKDGSLDSNGVVGVAPGAQLLVARVLDVDGSGSTSDVIAAVQWCTQQGANVLNLSLGSDESVKAEADAFAAAAEAGVLSIAATGNAGAEVAIGYPAGYASVMGVGAVTMEGEVADFSQFFPAASSEAGPKAGSVMAPGTEIQSTMIVGVGTGYTEELTVGGVSYEGSGLEFSPNKSYTGALVDCGLGATADSCGAGATCDGFVAYVERGGGIPFGDKARNAILQGAKAIIVGNNDPKDDATLGFTLSDASPDWVPTAAVTTINAALIKAQVGSQVTLPLAGSDYAVQKGTSMATPHVSGVAALVWSARPTLKNTEVRSLLQRSAKDVGTSGYDSASGYGLVQAKDALDLLNNP